MADASTKPRTKLEKAAVGELVLGRDKTLARLQEAANSRTAEARRQAAKKGDNERLALVAALLLVGRKLSGDLTDVLSRARAEARSASRKRLALELTAAGVAKAMPSAMGSDGRGRGAVDAAMAGVVADSLVTQWRAIVLSTSREVDGVKGTFDQAEPLIKKRLEGVAATEYSVAYNDEHHAVLVQMADRDPGLLALVMREWCAMVDACERCWPHDGERVAIGESFSGGDVPGSVHPRCMCCETIVAA